MGHLTRIANSIVHNSDKGPNGAQIQQLISGSFDRINIFLCNYFQSLFHSYFLTCRAFRGGQGTMGGLYFRTASRYKQEKHCRLSKCAHFYSLVSVAFVFVYLKVALMA